MDPELPQGTGAYPGPGFRPADPGQPSVQSWPGLDGLDPAPPVTPEPQGDPRLVQRVVRSVEIDASERSRFSSAMGELKRLHACPELLCRLLIDKDFELDLGHMTDM